MDGENGKQGGWWWDECGTFVFNPNVEGCKNEKFVSPDTVKHFAISDSTVYHSPTPEEHAVNVAAAREFEESNPRVGR